MKRFAPSATALVFAVVGVACAGEVQPEDELRVEVGRPNLRIAIVGAGPAGLTAAYELEKRNYQNVTVFEREARVGGKVLTFSKDGLNAELGAVFASPDYPVTLQLAGEVGIPKADSNTTRLIFDGGVKKTATESLFSRYTPEQVAVATQNYKQVLEQYPQIFDEKLNRLPPELEQNFDAFVEQFEIEPIAELGKALIIGFGYGYYDDVPAIYQLKILDMLVKVGDNGFPASPQFFTFPTGFQSLWVAVAATLNDVRLSSNVTNITRNFAGGRSRISLTVNGSETHEFDVVIVTAPLSAVPSFVSLTAYEKLLFSQVLSSRYIVSLVNVPGATRGEAVFVHDNALSSEINRVGVWASPSPASSIFQTWQIAAREPSQADLDAILRQDLTDQAGMVEVAGSPNPLDHFFVAHQVAWPDYFPRVSSDVMQRGVIADTGIFKGVGFFDVVELLQGLGGLYYAGGSLSFETVETSAAYAQRLVQERFRSLPAR